MGRRLGKAGRRWLLLWHRWLGIGSGLFFALWIGSGLVMLYVPFPSLTKAERLAGLGPLAWDAVRIAPDDALAVAGLSRVPAAFSLEMRGGEPVYRIAAGDGVRITVSAGTGARLGPVSEAEALRLVRGNRASPVWRDQWTVTAKYDPLRPFHKVALGDGLGTEVYVSAPTGEIALSTTRWERAWNWIGAVTHWVYLMPLRARPEAWRQTVLWLAGFACLTALSGVTIGIWRLRLRRRYGGGAVSPYRGLALWHHGFGLLGGLGLSCFIVSGWLSMNPNRWFSSLSPPESVRLAYADTPGPIGFSADDLPKVATPGLRQMRFASIGGRWWVILEEQSGPRAIDAHDSSQRESSASRLDATILTAAAAGAIPDGRLVSAESLREFDAYWYPQGGERPLPVLRLSFDDPAGTWLHIDPRDGTILNRLDRSGRINRWVFDAPHRLDIPVLTVHPPARIASQWLLNLLGMGIAVTGLVAGARRLGRRQGTAGSGVRSAPSGTAARSGRATGSRPS